MGDSSKIEKTISLLRELSKTTFFGKIEITFERGEVVNIKKIESIKP